MLSTNKKIFGFIIGLFLICLNLRKIICSYILRPTTVLNTQNILIAIALVLTVIIGFLTFKCLKNMGLKEDKNLKLNTILLIMLLPIFKTSYMFFQNIHELQFISFVMIFLLYFLVFLSVYGFIYIYIQLNKKSTINLLKLNVTHYFVFLYLILLFNFNTSLPIDYILGVACLFIILVLTTPFINSKFFSLLKNTSIILYCVMLINSINFEQIIENITPQKIITNEKIEVKNNFNKNIYIIVLDMYTGKDTLDEYNYDNSEFYTKLKNRNFFVQENIYSNYNKTTATIPSILNFNFIENLNFSQTANGISDSKLFNILKELNYQIWYLNGYEPINIKQNQNIDHLCNESLLTENLMFLTRTTIFNKLFSKIKFNNESLQKMFINSALNSDSKKLVFLHFLKPHWPYKYDVKKNELKEKLDFEIEKSHHKFNVENYLKYLEYTNNETIDLIDAILSKEKNKSIIIIMGDHGIRKEYYSNNEKKYFNDLTKDSTFLKAHFNTFIAYYNPEKRKNYSNIKSLVNFFRVFVNDIFDSNIHTLEDRFFYIFYDKDPIKTLNNLEGQNVNLP